MWLDFAGRAADLRIMSDSENRAHPHESLLFVRCILPLVPCSVVIAGGTELTLVKTGRVPMDNEESNKM